MKLKKRFSIILAAIACMVLFASCGSNTASEETYNGHSASEIETVEESLLAQLQSMDSDTIDQNISTFKTEIKDDPEGDNVDQYQMLLDLLNGYKESLPQCGEYNGNSDFDIDVAGKTVTATLTLDYSKRDMRVIFVYNKNTLNPQKPTSMNCEEVRTLGETMGRAALNVVIGMLVVFGVLILISLVIYAFRIIPYLQKKFNDKKNGTEAPAAAAPVEAAPAVQASDEMDDTELIAVITAAIAAGTGASTDSFVVRSIKRRY